MNWAVKLYSGVSAKSHIKQPTEAAGEFPNAAQRKAEVRDTGPRENDNFNIHLG